MLIKIFEVKMSTETSLQPSFTQALLASPYLIDMSAVFTCTSLANLGLAQDKTVLPKALFFQFLLQMTTTDLVEEQVIGQETKELINTFSSAYLFMGSYDALFEPLKLYVGPTIAKSIAFGAVPIPNLISLNNLINILQGEGTQGSGDIAHSPEIATNKFPALTSAVVYTSGICVKYSLTPEKVLTTFTFLQQGFAGGIGYATSKGVAELIDKKAIVDMEGLLFEFETGTYNHLLYGCVFDASSKGLVAHNIATEQNSLSIAAGLIETSEQSIRQKKEHVIEFNYYAHNTTSAFLAGFMDYVSNITSNDEL